MPPASPPRRRNPLLPFYVILGVVAVVGIGLVLRQTMKRGGGSATAAPVPVNIPPAELNATPGISMGRADAPVVMFQFADFQCPHCGEWAAFIEPLIKERLVETGKVRYVFYDFPLGGAFKHGFLASRAGRCANDQGRFWEYHDWLFGRQSEWSYSSDPAEKFVEYASAPAVGMDAGKFEECLRSDRFAKEVSQSRMFGEKLGVGSTPTLFMNGKRVTDLPANYQQLEALVNAELGAAAPAGGAPAPAADSPAAADTAAAAGTR